MRYWQLGNISKIAGDYPQVNYKFMQAVMAAEIP
jgi:hypothetical protein